MDFSQLNLPPQAIAELYGTSLVEGSAANASVIASSTVAANAASAATVSTSTPAKAEFKFLGENKKKILVLVKQPDAVFLSDAELDLLSRMFGACKMDLSDIAVVNLINYPASTYNELVTYFKAKVVMLFDISPSSLQMPIDFPLYQLQPLAGCTFLSSASITVIDTVKEEKTKLWNALRRLFNI